MKTCSFFGHRDTEQSEELKQKVKDIVERLIVEESVDTFLFGSRSNFDELCHIVVTELKEKYPYIRRIAYLCKHESGCLVGAGTSLKQKIKDLIALGYEQDKVFKILKIHPQIYGLTIENIKQKIKENQ